MAGRVILGIETTCDDTGVGIAVDGEIAANVIISSVDRHRRYGGVVPEIAARYHEANLYSAVKQAFARARMEKSQITHIAVATEPGLPGCLHVGKAFAKALGFLWGVPVIPVNHLHSHVYSAGIGTDGLTLPALGLVVSGGHTSIYLVNSPDRFQLLEETRDDAIGEVYDKVGRAMGMDYPAGPAIDRLFDPQKTGISFMNKALARPTMSYSGLKTAVINYLHRAKQRGEAVDVAAVSSSFQKTIIDDFVTRTRKQLSKHKVASVALGGGVSANAYLRAELKKLGASVQVPQIQYTNDNGAMHAYYANEILALDA